MYTVLVVDDKEVFRRKVKRLPYFQDHKDQFEIKFEAQNGLEAIELLRSNRVDIVLTDIRMPFVNGIELLKMVHAEGLCSCVILLSEFAEFSYAKAGILNGSFDYILKPIDNEKIQESFDRAYNYLATLTGTHKSITQKIELLTKFILAGDRINAMVYANHIETELRHRAGSNEDRIVLANDALRQLVDMILKKQAYLRFYVCFRPLWQLDVLEPIPERIVSDFGEKVMAISEAIAPFQLHTKNELVRKACLILLEGQGVGSLREVAGQLYSNPKYLGSLMKKELGMSFIQYATFIRTERSKLLLSGSDKIYEIAHAMGYNDVEYFSRVFKRHTGESPSAFRERCY